MPHRRSGFAKKIDTVHWTLFSEAFVSQGAGAAAVTAFPAQHLPETLMRIRGEWAAELVGPLAAGFGVQIAIGMALVPEGTGTTVLWSPITDGDAPWMWWDVFNLFYREMVVDVIGTNMVGARRVIDSKAMRKVRNRELQIVIENATITGLSAASVDVSLGGRALAGS